MQKNILIVDDDLRLRELLKDYLTEKKLDVYVCDDFDSAREIIQYFIFDLIILDRMMPTGDGIKLVSTIKQINTTPVIMLTAMGEDINKIEGLKIGADDYVSKPFEPEELYLRIMNLLNLYKNSNNEITNISFGDYIFNIPKLELKKNQEIIYLTEGENNLLLKTRVIGHSLKLDKFNFIERDSFKGKILSIGRLIEEKGYIYIFSAIKQIIAHYPDVTLDVYGEGPLEKDLSDYIKNNNLHNNIFLRGFLEHKKLLNSFCDYDLFISHPIEMDHIAEAFHMGNMEAMASGLPVITTDCGGVPFVVKDNAIVCRQMSIEDIVKSIEKLLTDKILFNKMSVKSRKYIEDNFSHEIIVKKWREVFDEK